MLILKEKVISAMMTEKRKTETSVEERKKTVEQLKEDVTRLQLYHSDCSDVAVQSDEVRHDFIETLARTNRITDTFLVSNKASVQIYMYFD